MAKKLMFLYEKLLLHYGQLHWWPARTPYEVMVGAILTQNTNWNNVEKAIANFGEELSPQRIRSLELASLSNIIQPAGFFNQKAVYLKEMTAWYERYGYEVATVQAEPMDKLRKELLATKGIGRETADSILLYAFGFASFVVDAYTMRLCQRYPIQAGTKYEEVKSYFERHLPQEAEIYNTFHALIVIHAKEHCRKKPICTGCPVAGSCDYNKEPPIFT